MKLEIIISDGLASALIVLALMTPLIALVIWG